MIEVRGDAAQEIRTLFFRTWRTLTAERPPDDVRRLTRRRSRPVWVLASQWRTRRSMHREYVLRIRHARGAGSTSPTRTSCPTGACAPRSSTRCSGARRCASSSRRGATSPSCSLPARRSSIRSCATGWSSGSCPGRCSTPRRRSSTTSSPRSAATTSTNGRGCKNLEINLAVEDQPFARHVRSWFEHDLARATRVDLASWRERSLARRGFEWASYAMRRLW